MNRQIPDIMKELASATDVLDQALLIDEMVALNECPIDSLTLYDVDWTDAALQLGSLKFICLGRQYYPPLDNATQFLARIFPQLQQRCVKDWIFTVYQLGVQVPKKIFRLGPASTPPASLSLLTTNHLENQSS